MSCTKDQLSTSSCQNESFCKGYMLERMRSLTVLLNRARFHYRHVFAKKSDARGGQTEGLTICPNFIVTPPKT